MSDVAEADRPDPPAGPDPLAADDRSPGVPEASTLAAPARPPAERVRPAQPRPGRDGVPAPARAPAPQREDWMESIQSIRDVAGKMRDMQAWAQDVTRNAYAVANKATAATRAAEERARQAEAALDEALARAERAEKLVQSLTKAGAARQAIPAPQPDRSPARPAAGVAASARPAAAKAGPAPLAPPPAVGKSVDIVVGDGGRPRLPPRIIPPFPAGQARVRAEGPREGAREGVPADFRNESEFNSLTY